MSNTENVPGKTHGEKLKYTLIGTVVVCAILIFIFVFPKGKVEAPALNQFATSTDALGESGQTTTAGIESLKKIEETEKYSIEYPEVSIFSLPNKNAEKKINDQIKADTSRHISEFKKETADSELLSKDIKHGIQITLGAGDTVFNKILALNFIVSTYFSGAAHPLTFSVTHNFDVMTGKDIKLEDIFKSNSGYIEKIASYSKTALEEKFKKNDIVFFEEGVEAKAENFKAFLITKNGLKILFGQYQVAPYAVGEQEVLIPYSELKDLFQNNDITAVLK